MAGGPGRVDVDVAEEPCGWHTKEAAVVRAKTWHAHVTKRVDVTEELSNFLTKGTLN